MIRRLFVPLVVLLSLVLWPGSAAAQGTCTKSWTGSAGDGVWGTAANWAPSGVPGAGDQASIPSGATVQVQSGHSVGSVESAGSLQLTSGSLSVSDASQAASLTISGGSLGGAGTLNVSDSFSWTAGDMNGTGRTVLGSGVTGSIAMPSETSMVALSQRALVNRGTLTFSRGRIFGRDAGSIENEGTFRMNAESGDGLYNWVGTQPSFTNTGTVEKTAGGGRSVIGFRFDNRGAVRAENGELAFSGGASAPGSDGSWNGSGGVISFDGGAFSVGRWDMAGSIQFRSSTVTAAGLTAPAADVEISGGSLTVTDDAVASQVRGLALTVKSSWAEWER